MKRHAALTSKRAQYVAGGAPSGKCGNLIGGCRPSTGASVAGAAAPQPRVPWQPAAHCLFHWLRAWLPVLLAPFAQPTLPAAALFPAAGLQRLEQELQKELQNNPPELKRRYDASTAADLIAAVGWSWAIEEVRGSRGWDTSAGWMAGSQRGRKRWWLSIGVLELPYCVLWLNPRSQHAASHPTGAGDWPRCAAAEAKGCGGQDHWPRCAVGVLL